ncbi:MAG: 50S ribosomal subunit protein L19 [Candidatus Hodgkinia cicadicola]|nr:MAG: 50S ribosomal subunit protein L19 [Candidatus Hodgkinia cicadicola]
MNWLLLGALRSVDFSVINFGAGSQLAVPLKGSKGETIEFAGVCVATKSKSPCINYTIRKFYAEAYVERKFSFGAIAPKLRLRVSVAKKAALKHLKLCHR